MSNQQPIHVHVHRETGCLKFVLIVAGIIAFFAVLVKLEVISKHVDREHFDRIQIGMTLPMVENVINNRWKELPAVGNMRTIIFTDGPDKSITVVFVDGKVSDKSSMGID